MSADDEPNLFSPARSRNKLIRNSKILMSEYVPKRIVGRRPEMESVANILRPCIEEEEGVPCNVIIYGKPGTGKTLVVRHVTSQFGHAVECAGKYTTPYIVYISCGKISGHVATIRHIIESIDPDAAISTGYDTNVYYDRLYTILNKKRRGLILILDEIDRLPDNKLLYNLSRKHQSGDLSQEIYIGIIGLTNYLHYADTWDASVRSSFGRSSISFKPYDALEIAAILQARIDAYHQDTLGEDVIPYIAGISAQEHGDARLALELFHRAGTIAETKNKMVVDVSDVNDAKAAIENDQVLECISTLPAQSRYILAAILSYYQKTHKSPSTTNAFSLYQLITTCHDRILPLGLRRYQDLVNELGTLGLIDVTVSSKGRYGRFKKITPSVGDNARISKILDQFVLMYGAIPNWDDHCCDPAPPLNELTPVFGSMR